MLRHFLPNLKREFLRVEFDLIEEVQDKVKNRERTYKERVVSQYNSKLNKKNLPTR